MRLFFALWPDDPVRAALAVWSRELLAVCGGRPTQAGNLRLTLAFLGGVEDARVGEVERAAQAVVPRHFPLTLDLPGYWKHNRIAWAGASAVPPELEEMVRDLRGALEGSGIGFDSKAFVSHVTLLRDAREPAAMPAVEPIRWEADGFALVRSPAGRGGSYDILDSWRVRRRR